jgi:hypothetical protein
MNQEHINRAIVAKDQQQQVIEKTIEDVERTRNFQREMSWLLQDRLREEEYVMDGLNHFLDIYKENNITFGKNKEDVSTIDNTHLLRAYGKRSFLNRAFHGFWASWDYSYSGLNIRSGPKVYSTILFDRENPRCLTSPRKDAPLISVPLQESGKGHIIIRKHLATEIRSKLENYLGKSPVFTSRGVPIIGDMAEHIQDAYKRVEAGEKILPKEYSIQQ